MTRTTDFKSVPPTGESQTRRPRFSGLSRSAAVLFRLGTARARLAAALLVVAGGLLYQTEAQALEQASRKVLYLDAPSVSVPRAERAGDAARGYAGPDSDVPNDVLAWVHVTAAPQDARWAFASITDPSGRPPGGVSYDDAVAAGDAMVAQIGGEPPVPDAGGDDELASAEPVRPTLGDGTKATDAPGPQTGAPPPPDAADTSAPADLGLPAPMAQAYAPSESPAKKDPATSPSSSNSDEELAAVPDAPATGKGGSSGTPDIGPMADDYAPRPTPTSPSKGSAGQSAESSDPPADDQDDSQRDSSGSEQPDAIEQKSSPIVVVPDSSSSEDDSNPEYAAGNEPSDDVTSSQPTPGPAEQPQQTASPVPEDPQPEEQPSEEQPFGEQPSGSSSFVAIVPAEPEADEGQSEKQASPSPATSSEPASEPSTEPTGEGTTARSPNTGDQADHARRSTPDPAAEPPEPGSTPAASTTTPDDPQDSAAPSESADAQVPPAESPQELSSDTPTDETTGQQISIVVQDNASQADASTPEPEEPPTNSPGPQQAPQDSPSDKSEAHPDTGGDSSGKTGTPDTAPNSDTKPGDQSDAPQDAPQDASEDAPQDVPEDTLRDAPEDAPQNPDGSAGNDPAANRGARDREQPREVPEPAGGSPAAAPKKNGTDAGRQDSASRSQPAPPASDHRAKPSRKGGEGKPPGRTSPQPPAKTPPKHGGGKGVGGQGPTQTAGAVKISSQSPFQDQPDLTPGSQDAAAGVQNDIPAAPTAQQQTAADPVGSAQRAVRRAEARAQRRAARQPTAAALEVAPTEESPVQTAPAAIPEEPVVEPDTNVRQAARQQRRAQRIAARQAAVPSQAPAELDHVPAAPDTGVPEEQPTVDGYQGGGYQDESEAAVPQASDMAAEIDSYTQEEAVGAASAAPEPDLTGTREDSYSEPAPPTPDPVSEAYVEEVAADPGVTAEPVMQDTSVPAAPDAAPVATPTETYVQPEAQAVEPQLEPVQQVSTQQLEPVQQVPTMELEPAPQPTDAAPEAATGAAAPEMVQQVQSTVDVAVPNPAGGTQ